MKNPMREYSTYDQAYDYFNVQLFAGSLPACLSTLQHQRHSYGYFSPKRFVARTNGDD